MKRGLILLVGFGIVIAVALLFYNLVSDRSSGNGGKASDDPALDAWPDTTAVVDSVGRL